VRTRKNDSAAYQQVEYHAPGWKIDAEYVSSFVPHNHLTSGRYASRDYDYMRPRADLSIGRSDPRSTGHADGEVYQWHARQGPAATTRSRGQAMPKPTILKAKAGSWRCCACRPCEPMAPGRGPAAICAAWCPAAPFNWSKHPRQKANAEYLVLDTRFLIEDVAQDSQIGDASPGGSSTGRWRSTSPRTRWSSRCAPCPRDPSLHARPPDGAWWSALPARTSGPTNWAASRCSSRGTASGKRGPAQHLLDSGVQPWAGNQLGGIHVPRIGQEVIVDFFGGDPDLPICTGRAYNQANLPPWALPGQQALSGFQEPGADRTKAATARRGAQPHRTLDDTAGKIQVQLKSDHQHSQLSLGHITRRGQRGAQGRRGQGFELRTDGHGALRAKDGMLITTEGRSNAEAHLTDMGETVARLTRGAICKSRWAARPSKPKAQDTGDQDEVAKALKAQNDAIKGAGKKAIPKRPFPELAEPHLVLASPRAFESTSGKAPMCKRRAQRTHSGAHTSISAAKSFLVSAKQALRLFAYKAGIRLFAFGGDIDIKALKDSISIIAKLNIVQVANRITITAKEELVLNGGGSTIRLNASGIEEATSGKHIEYAAVHSMVGPKNAPTVPVDGSSSLKDIKTARTFVLRSHAEDGRVIAVEPYTLYKDGIEVKKGVTDAHGQVLIDDHQEGTGSYKVKLTNGNEFDLPVTSQLKSADQKLAAQGYRAARDDLKDRQQHYQHRQDDADET
jgi:type VI secretion system secreted protein VgrG